ncbi:tetratricopeptide repeat-containing sulfotransferase family protein [Lichenicola sp.]|uniref:tetratricopeptide repeat-containing sulfotransferase family protein n=1 Tax=Lichenicola sp. TaxID=2804529 RepID=UPI003AFF9624
MSHAESLLPTAEAHYRAGAYAQAVSVLEPLASDVAPLPDVLRIFGLCRLRQGEPSEAIDLLARAHALAPNDPWCRLHYGIALQSVGRHLEAASMFRSCQALLPDDPAPPLNLCSSLLGLGDVRGALRAARKARARAPGLAQAHYMLGLADLAGDLFDRASVSFREATRLSPGFAEAWLNLGVAQYRSGNIEAAKRSMRAALHADPDNHAAASNLGGFMRLSGESEASENLLGALIKRKPDFPGARLNLAADLLQEDRATEALALLEGAGPGDAMVRQHWMLQRALALISLGRLTDAHAELDAIGTVSPALAPLLHWRLARLAMAEGETDRARLHAGAMEAAMQTAGASMLPEHGIMTHYDLARFWAQLREPDRAFPHWVAGHRKLSRFQPFSRTAHADLVDATIARFDQVRLRHGQIATNRDPSPVFVVGMPRSGTTLIEQILAAHRDVHGAGERSALADMQATLGAHPDKLDTAQLDAVAADYLRELHALAPSAGRIVDKMPGNVLHLGLVALMLPAARIISCDRDPRDIGLSIFTFRFYGHHPYAHDLADLGWYIGQHRRLMAHWQAVLPNPVMTVRLADWVDDFPGTLSRVLKFLDLPHDPNCETFHELERRVRTVSRAQVRQPISARGIGRWREYATHLEPLIASLEESGVLRDYEL